MNETDLEIRMLLLRAQPGLSLSRAESLIRGVASSCLDILEDNAAHGVMEQGFCTFSHVDGVALVAIMRKPEIEFLVIAADESFIHETKHLAMVDVDEFMRIARARFQVPEVGLVLPMPQAMSWMERDRKDKRSGENNHVV